MELKLPNLGEGADSGTVVNLFVKEGDQISKDQPILELENEKAVATIPSSVSGTVSKIFVKTGDKLTVGQSILSLSEERSGEAPKSKAAPAAKAQKEAPEPEKQQPEREPERSPAADQPQPGIAPAASPSMRKLARDLGIDLTRVRGGERGGRIVLGDLRVYIQRLQSRAAGPPPKAGAAAPSA